MNYITDGFSQAFHLLISGDDETYCAIWATVKTSSLSILIATAIGVPAGFLLGHYSFPLKTQLRAVVDTLLALPTVVVGLLVYAFISRRGPLGEMEILFTISGIVLAQVILITPIVVSLTATAIEGLDHRLHMTLMTLGARGRQIAIASIYEARFAVLTAVITAYGRAVSEVGISMMIGGNIKWHTRTITTAIALETGKGQFAMGIALGLVLIAIAFFVNGSLTFIKRKN